MQKINRILQRETAALFAKLLEDILNRSRKKFGNIF